MAALVDRKLREHLDTRAGEMKHIRLSWEPQIRDIARYMSPQRGEFFRTPGQVSRGTQKNQAIIDTVARFGIRTLRAGLMGGLTSPARPWFRLTVADQDLNKSAAVRAWLDHVAERILMVFASSNLYSVLPLLYQELAVFGTASAFVEEDFHDVIRVYLQTTGSFWIALDDRRVVDTHLRKIMMPARAAIRRWGDKLPKNILDKKGKAGADGNVGFWHLIEPNDEFEEGSLGAKGKKWRSVYWPVESSNDEIVQVTGYEEWPLLTPRWEVLTDDPYGTGCGHDALPDVKSLQILGKRRHNAVDQHVNPAMAFPAELKNQATGTTPGFVNYFAGNLNEKVGRPLYQTSPAVITPLQALIADTRDVVNRTFYADLFLMISQMDGVQPRNQLEIMARKEEKLLMLGPVLDALHGELLSPLVDRAYAIMVKHRMFMDPPQELHGYPLEVEMISMLAQAQKAVQVGAIEREVGFISSLVGAFPQAADKIDIYTVIDQHSDAVGTPAGMIRGTDDAQKLADARNKQLQAQQAMQTGMALAQGAKTASEANLDSNNMLGRMTGQPPQQAAA